EHVALGVDAIAAFDTVELPFLLSAIQVPTEDFCRLSCVFDTAYIQEKLDRRVLALSGRLVDCDVGRDALRYLKDDQLKGWSLEHYVVFIDFTLCQAGHMFVKLRQRPVILRIDHSPVRNRLRHIPPPMAIKSNKCPHAKVVGSSSSSATTRNFVKFLE